MLLNKNENIWILFNRGYEFLENCFLKYSTDKINVENIEMELRMYYYEFRINLYKE